MHGLSLYFIQRILILTQWLKASGTCIPSWLWLAIRVPFEQCTPFTWFSCTVSPWLRGHRNKQTPSTERCCKRLTGRWIEQSWSVWLDDELSRVVWRQPTGPMEASLIFQSVTRAKTLPACAPSEWHHVPTGLPSKQYPQQKEQSTNKDWAAKLYFYLCTNNFTFSNLQRRCDVDIGT